MAALKGAGCGAVGCVVVFLCSSRYTVAHDWFLIVLIMFATVTAFAAAARYQLGLIWVAVLGLAGMAVIGLAGKLVIGHYEYAVPTPREDRVMRVIVNGQEREIEVKGVPEETVKRVPVGAMLGGLIGWAAGLGLCIWLSRRRPENGYSVEHWSTTAEEYYGRMSDEAGLTALPAEWQRELVALMLADRDINNGGYVQFLANHGREMYAYASQALRAVGAARTATILDTCQALIDEHFPSEGKSRTERRCLLPNPILNTQGETLKEAGSVLPDAVLARLRELSREYMAAPENVDRLAGKRYSPLISADRSAPGEGGR